VTSVYQNLQDRLAMLGLSPKKSLGQNFLIEETVIARILKSVEQSSARTTIEIGPGCGALTEGLLLQNKSLKVIELDTILSKYWESRGLSVITDDALRVDWSQLVTEGETCCLVSNLPYQISSSLVIDRALGPEGVREMVLMFQKEVAERILAKPRTEDYGLLSVIAQTFFSMQRVVDASPQCFFPKPNVASRVLSFVRKESPTIGKERQFLSFVKQAFAQRRKLLVKNLNGYRSTVDWAELLTKHDLNPKVRAEQLSPEQFVRLFVEGVR
jgi:16S rRNA (adenine1518-N6/adenine1519-N6)-dimethyltransferase